MSIAGSARGINSSFNIQPDARAERPERGVIRTVKKQRIKGQEYSVPNQIEVPFLFNPSELSVAKTNTWNLPDEGKFSNTKTLEFGGGEPQTITLQLFFDTYELHDARQLNGRPNDVRNYTDKLLEMMQVQDGLGPNDGSGQKWPPQVQIEWGKIQQGWKFACYITSMTQKFLLFLPNGTPVRATVDLTLKNAEDGKLSPQNPTSGGQGNERTRMVLPGERLDWIAYQEYGDSTLWRLIADANGLNDLDLIVGMRLAIPPRAR